MARKLVASFGEITGAQDVRVLSVEALKKGDATPLARFDFSQSVPNDFTFSADGRYLYGSSYLTGVSNIFRYELATGKLEAVSNTETGFFRPVPLGGDELLVFRYTGSGFVPTRIDRHADCGRQPDHVSRRAARRRSPGRAQLERRLADGDSVRLARQTAAAIPVVRWPATGIVLPDRPGIQGHRRRRHAGEPVGSRCG